MAVTSLSGVARPTLAQEGDFIAVAYTFSAVGDAGPADTRYVWSVGEPEGSWQVSLVGPADEHMRLQLTSFEGTVLEMTRSNGEARLFDLDLQPGDYSRSVQPSAGGSLMLAATLTSSDSSCPRISEDLLDVQLDSPDGVGRVLCLLDASHAERQCRSGAEGLSLTDLRLEGGNHVVRVRGSADAASPYSLAVSVSGQRRPDYEAEPNDDAAVSSPVDPALGVRGRSGTADHDFHAVLMSDQMDSGLSTMTVEQKTVGGIVPMVVGLTLRHVILLSFNEIEGSLWDFVIKKLQGNL